jgi:hypothetical protein
MRKLLSPSATLAALLFMFFASCSPAEDDGGFHSIREWRTIGITPREDEESADDIFDRTDIAKLLATVKRVRFVRCQTDPAPDLLRYWDLEKKAPVQPKLHAGAKAVELNDVQYQPLLKQLLDIEHYGDTSLCGFDPGLAIIIGDGEPEFIVVCCFKCHDIKVVRRPTATHPMPHVSELGMSPELERAIFNLALASFPQEEDLKSFQLPERHRSKTPLQPPTSPSKDPMARDATK